MSPCLYTSPSDPTSLEAVLEERTKALPHSPEQKQGGNVAAIAATVAVIIFWFSSVYVDIADPE